jgi:hypothetical protein
MLSVAKCEPGWGDLSSRAPFDGRDCHPTPPLISFASTLPLQGRVKKRRKSGFDFQRAQEVHARIPATRCARVMHELSAREGVGNAGRRCGLTLKTRTFRARLSMM